MAAAGHHDERRRAMEATLTRYHAAGRAPRVDDLGLFLTDAERPDVHDANHLRHPRAATDAEIDHLLNRFAEIYPGATHRKIVCDLDTPDALEARLCLDGWQLDPGLQHLLEGPLLLDRKPLEGLTIRPAVDDEDWASMIALTRLDHVEESRTFGRPLWGLDLTVAMVEHRRRKAPEVQAWLASIDGVDQGMFSSMPGDNGVGLVEDLFVHPEARGRGVAQALIAHCVADARARGAGPVIIGSRPDDWPKQLYARLGFRPWFVERSWDLEKMP